MSTKLENTKELLRRLKNNPESFTYEIAALTAEAALELIEGMQQEHSDIVYNHEWELRKTRDRLRLTKGLGTDLLRVIEGLRQDLPFTEQQEIDEILSYVLKKHDAEFE